MGASSQGLISVQYLNNTPLDLPNLRHLRPISRHSCRIARLHRAIAIALRVLRTKVGSRRPRRRSGALSNCINYSVSVALFELSLPGSKLSFIRLLPSQCVSDD
jgi:hypothetical protein